MICGVCDILPSKYKCPACRKPYCSLPCWKIHKRDECKGSEETKVEIKEKIIPVSSGCKATYNYPTDDTVEPEKLKLLGQSQKLKAILSNRHVCAKLAEIDADKDPGYAVRNAMQEPIFVEFADICMHILEPWTKEELREERLLN